MTILGAMLHVMAAWLISYGLLTGVGLMLRRQPPANLETVFNTFWIGWAGSITLLQFWHLFFPVNAIAALLLALYGAVGLIHRGRSIPSLVRENRAFLPILLILALYPAYRALGALQYDDGLYHLPVTRWIESHPVVLGLGNLHSRYAFNSAHWYFMAMLDGVPIFPAAHTIGSTLLVFAFLMQGAYHAWLILKQSERQPLYRYLHVLLIVPLWAEIWLSGIATYSNDPPVLILALLLMVHLMRVLESTEVSLDDLLLAAWLVGVGITIKLSFAVFGLTVLGVIFWRKSMLERLLATAIITRAFFPWLAHNILMSGYLVYLLPLPIFSDGWQLPESTVEQESTLIRAWARDPYYTDPEDTLAGWDWLSGWVKRDLLTQYDRVGVALALLALAVILLLLNRFRVKPARLWLYLLPFAAGLLFWFWSAPAIRFGLGQVWGLGAGLPIIAAQFERRQFLSMMRYGTLGLTALLLVGVLARNTWTFPENGFTPIPEPVVHEVETRHGLMLLEPEDRCWDAPLNCTSFPNPDLRLRGETLESGFIVDKD